MNLLLINTGNDLGLAGHANAQSYPPLGIISLGTAVRDVFGDAVQVTLSDGQVDDVGHLASRIRRERPDVVGLSMYCTSTRNTLRLVREAKGIGATTIIGNDHAAFHFETLLTKVPEVDYVCTGDVGEDSLVALVGCLLGTGRPSARPDADRLSEVPDLAFRHDERVVTSAVRRHRAGAGAMDDIAIPDRTLLPERYWSHYLACFKRQHRKLFDSSAVPGIATINRARGCARSKSPCRYCGIADLTPRGSSADLFWRDVRRAREEVGATVLHEAFDSATSWPGLCRRWADARPDDLNATRFFMYAQAAETNPAIVDTFRRLGVFCVNTGFDSGDDRALKLLKGSGDSVEINRAAARLWTDAGIEVHTSFVLIGLGSDDATRRSLDRTLEFAEWLATDTSTVSFDRAMLYPDKSSPVGSWIWEPRRQTLHARRLGWTFVDPDRLRRMSEKWRDQVELDPLEMCIDFARVCGADPEILIEYDRRIAAIAARMKANCGVPGGGGPDCAESSPADEPRP